MATYNHPHDTVDRVVNFISTTQMLRSASLLVGFVFAVCNRKLWFGVDMLAAGVFALGWIFIPGYLLDFQISRSTIDGVDLELGRMLGCTLLGNAVLWFLLTKQARDPDTVHPALLLTRVVSLGVLLIAMIDIQLFSKAWGPEHVTFGILGVCCWLAGNAYHLARGGYPAGHVQRDRQINNFLLFDMCLSVFLGFALYGFPRWFLRNFTLIRTLDGVHEHLTRAFGAMIFGSGMFAFQAVGFLDDRDKEAHFIHRLVINASLFLCTLYAQFFYYREWNQVHCWGINFALILWSIHAYLGWKNDSYNRVSYAGRRLVGANTTAERTMRTRGKVTTDYGVGISGGDRIGGVDRKLVADYGGDYDRED